MTCPPCPRDRVPFGYEIKYANNADYPAWLVMRWGRIVAVCDDLEGAYRWLVTAMQDDLEKGEPCP